ncbi:DUF1345 domain-containing protein [Agrococcus versicolor]
MSKPARRLHRDLTRHTVAIAAATLVACALLLVLLVVDERIRGASSLVVSLTLVFGVYGPIFLGLTHVAFGSLPGAELRDRLRTSDEQRTLVRLLLLGGPKTWATTIVAVGVTAVLLLATGDARESLWLVGACVLCVVGTWVLLVAVFAVEYMRLWANDGSLRFPGDDEPTFADFVYLSVQLSTTFSSSDVELVATPARRLATVHSVVAFAYSTVIVAVFASLLISTAA